MHIIGMPNENLTSTLDLSGAPDTNDTLISQPPMNYTKELTCKIHGDTCAEICVQCHHLNILHNTHCLSSDCECNVFVPHAGEPTGLWGACTWNLHEYTERRVDTLQCEDCGDTFTSSDIHVCRKVTI